MTNKKIIIIVVAVVVVLGLIVLLFVGGIVGSVFYGIANSDAANVSREFLRKNPQLQQDIGEVKDFGKLVTGNINFNNGDGTAQLSLKVFGERKTVNATVELTSRNGQQWLVTAASYRNDEGQTIDLLNPYETRAVPPRIGQAFLPVLLFFQAKTDKNVCPTKVILKLAA